jgi:pSer/pThr/pTyr-binding forkhead associated (FHA) protein
MLALQNQPTPNESGSLIRLQPDTAGQLQRQTALSVPDSELPLGEPLSPFFDACGGVDTISVSARMLDSQASADVHLFRQPFFIIGRSSQCDLVVPDRTAGFRHIYVQLISGRWFFINLARISRTASGRGQPESGWFDAGCQLTVGSHVVTHVATGPQAGALAVPHAQPPRDLPIFELEMLKPTRAPINPSTMRFCAPVTLIGASPKCELFLNDESVSKVHASVVLTPRGLWVIDLLGRGGVLVDGRAAFWKQINDGTVLQIGRYHIRVRCDCLRAAASTRIEARRPKNVPLPSFGPVPGGSLSEGAVLTLIGQLADMQNQFFEQSRLQMQWMSEMISHVGRAQQESARRDIARIEEIGNELREIKSQLAAGAERSNASADLRQNTVRGTSSEVSSAAKEIAPRLPGNTTSRKSDSASGPPSTTTDSRIGRARSESQSPPGAGQAGVTDSMPDHRPMQMPAIPAAQGPRAADSRAGAAPRLPTASPTVDAHARLAQRMAALSQEQSNVWRRLMNTLSGRPNG